MKLQPSLDVSLEEKAVKLLESVDPPNRESTDAFLLSLGRTTADSSSDFVQCIGVLISSASQVITTAAMKMLGNLIMWCSAKVRLTLVSADLIPQLITTLNPLSLSFTEAVDIHTCLMRIIMFCLRLATPFGLPQLACAGLDEQLAVPETIFQQVLIPSEKYIYHLCVNRFSIIDGDQFGSFLSLFAHLLEICPYHQPTMYFVLRMPVVFTIPSCLASFENEMPIIYFLHDMNNAQLEWNKRRGVVRQMWKKVLRMLRMEGFENTIEEKLQSDKNGDSGGWIVDRSIGWSNQQGMNVPEQE
ncbi:hypothetical protein BLNAU_7524 [Blattamonas nauphoetae]|uniref:Uncharacterized protein n=1 Tax=Blattamonas nauphoetae TaxID=2049346 RepID=A0ABQ9Y1L9_9EUKA|nr:hypothetical protein BLNAU_7524 [Blattamonas nauphoetae]